MIYRFKGGWGGGGGGGGISAIMTKMERILT